MAMDCMIHGTGHGTGIVHGTVTIHLIPGAGTILLITVAATGTDTGMVTMPAEVDTTPVITMEAATVTMARELRSADRVTEADLLLKGASGIPVHRIRAAARRMQP